MPREVWPIVAAHWSTPKFYHGLSAHLRSIRATVGEMHDAPPIVGIPTLLITAGTAEPLSPEALLQIGPTARQVIAENSGHWVHLDEHDLVFESIRAMVEEIRVNAPESIDAVEKKQVAAGSGLSKQCQVDSLSHGPVTGGAGVQVVAGVVVG
jgi:hypothetical protein